MLSSHHHEITRKEQLVIYNIKFKNVIFNLIHTTPLLTPLYATKKKEFVRSLINIQHKGPIDRALGFLARPVNTWDTESENDLIHTSLHLYTKKKKFVRSLMNIQHKGPIEL
jgi:hypothetical protein